MPTPPEGPTSDVEDMGAESSGGREDVAAGDGTPHAGTPRWTDEDWRRWNAGTWSWDQGRDGLPSTGTASAPDEGQSTSGHGGNQARRSSTTQSDPWSQPWRDPWANGHGGCQKDETLEERGSGGSDKIVVPDFSGEEDRDGTKARGYLRKIEAWRRVTRLKANKQALVLYNNLTGKAWRDAEDLALSTLDDPYGVERYVAWITQRYLDKEVVKAGKYMSDFFKFFKKGPNQDIRDYNSEFDRHLAKLKEVGCVLPGLCSSWWYIDKMRLDNSTELNLLASVNNQYDLGKLQEAAVVQDRMNRRIWETSRKSDDRHGKKNQQAYITELDDIPEYLDDLDDVEPYGDEESPDEDDTEAHEAFVAYQNAKAKYSDVLKARGTNPAKTQEEALAKAKSRSFCSACGKKGHWHKDIECPKNKGKSGEGAPHVTHVVFYTDNMDLDTVVDCACSRTLAGVAWCKKYLEVLKKFGIPYIVIEQEEHFKFGGPRLYPSTRAIVGWLAIAGRWFMIKISIVSAQVPLLLSRPVLASLGMNYKMDTNVADFPKLKLVDVALSFTASGHPKVNALDFGETPQVPTWPEGVDWSVTEVHILAPDAEASRAYMVHAAPGINCRLFYPKVHGHVMEMLSNDVLAPETFLHWWNQQVHSRDFWIEDEDYMIRVHVTPRRTCFDPGRWTTSDLNLKSRLLQLLDNTRETTCIPCYGNGLTYRLEHQWHDDTAPRAEFLWIGRSRFRRRRVTSQTRDTPIRDSANVQDCNTVAMEDEARRAGGSLGGHGDPRPVRLDSAGAAGDPSGSSGSSWRHDPQGCGSHPHVLGRPEGEVCRGGACTPTKADTRLTDEDAAGQPAPVWRGEGDLWVSQGVQVQGSQLGLPQLGHQGGEQQPTALTGSGPSGQMGSGGEEQATPWSTIREWGSRALGHLASATRSFAEGQGEASDVNQAAEDIKDASHRGGFKQWLRPDLRCGSVSGGSDQGHGEPSSGTSCGEEGRGQEEGRTSLISRTKEKRRDYWKKMEEIHKLRRSMRARSCYITENADISNIDAAFVETYELDNDEILVGEAASDPLDINEYDLEKETKNPRIKLSYPEDFEEVRNLPSKRMKKVAKKRVKSWVHKTLLCLTTTLVALATPVVAELHEAVVEPAQDLCKAVLGPNTFQGKKEEIALLELFAGSAHLTEEFAAKGYNVLEPRDILLGHNLFDPLQQETVFNDINYKKPKLLWVALPCTKWSQWQRLNYAQRRQALRRARAEQRRLIHFAVECAWNQIANGNEVMFEHPKYSELWTDRSMESFMDNDFVVTSDLDMCRYDLRAVTDGGRLRKPTKIASTDPKLLKGLRRTCAGGHEHTPTEGRNTKPAGAYTKTFCRAVIEGYQNMSSSVWAPPCSHDAAHPTWEALAAQEAVGDDQEVPEPKLTSIEFPAHVPVHLAKALRRVHQNLGHPANHDLARHLKLSGASEAAVKAAHSLRCSTCARLGNPGTRRPAKLVRPLEFNQEVCLDTINLFDADNNKVEALSVLDMASGYHVVKQIRGRKSTDLLADCTDCWMIWAGPPMKVTCDQERGFIKDFVDGVEMAGSTVRFIAGQAHWQQGAIERQGEWYRAMWDRTVAHSRPSKDEINYTLAMVSAAKNNLRRKHGYSPTQWLFGAEPRLGDAVLDEDSNLYYREELRSPDEVWRRRQTIRLAAREAFLQTQADSTLRRALLGRPRSNVEVFEQGDCLHLQG